DVIGGQAEDLALLPSQVASGTWVWSPDGQTVAFVVTPPAWPRSAPCRWPATSATSRGRSTAACCTALCSAGPPRLARSRPSARTRPGCSWLIHARRQVGYSAPPQPSRLRDLDAQGDARDVATINVP